MFAIALSQVASSWELLSSNSALHSYRFRVASLICPFGQKSWGKHCNDTSYWQSERHTVCRCAFETTINRNTNWKRDREIQTAIPIWLLYFHSFFIFRIRFYWLVRISYCCWCCRWRRWRHYHRFLCFHRLCNNNECAVWMVLTGQNNKIEIIGTSDDGEEENGAEIEKYSDWTCQHWRKATRRRRWYRCQSNNIEAVVSMQSHIYIYIGKCICDWFRFRITSNIQFISESEYSRIRDRICSRGITLDTNRTKFDINANTNKRYASETTGQ